MWFKNIHIYRFTKTFRHSINKIEESLEGQLFQPCGSIDLFKAGWAPPLGRHGEMLTHSTEGAIMVCAKRQDKVLPASVINEQVEEHALAIEAAEGRKVFRKERSSLKEDVIQTLLPKAFVKSSLNFAYIAPKDGWILINTASTTRAEEILNLLRESLGSLSVIPPSPKHEPLKLMTRWLKTGKLPKGFTLTDECEMVDARDEGGTIRCKNQDLASEEISSHLDAGKMVTKVGLCWNDTISFVLDENLTIKKIRYADELLEKLDEYNAETFAEQFDLEFSFMPLELKGLITDLLDVFGEQ